MNIGICDDEIEFIEKLNIILMMTLKKTNHEIFIKYFLNGYDLLEEINKLDVLFLDYEMPLLNGIDILKKNTNKTLIIIIITKYDHIVFSTFEFGIYWFIRKSHLKNDIDKCLKKLLKEFNKNSEKFKYSSYNKSISLYFHLINYVITEKNYIKIYTDDTCYKIRETFNSISKKFNSNLFLIPSYGILINMNFIVFIDFHSSIIYLNNGKEIKISRSKKKEVKEVYGSYLTKL